MTPQPTDAPQGEAALLARLQPHLCTSPLVEIGPGDDAAVLRPGIGRIVASTDTIVEGYDFLPETTCPRWVGEKAAVQNLADIAAMGARPVALLSSLSAPADTSAHVFEQVTAGLAERAASDGAVIVGGDLGRADVITLTVTALGTLADDAEPVLRSGARPGDVLAIGTERLGRSAAGLALVLSRQVRVGREGTVTGAAGYEELVRHHNAPRVDLQRGWGSGRAAHAMLDLSDGLVRDGARIAAASAVSLDLDPAALQPDVEALAELATCLETDPWQWVLHGGEEHAMLATFAPSALPQDFRPIGRVIECAAHPVTLGGEPIRGRGFDHFQSSPVG